MLTLYKSFVKINYMRVVSKARASLNTNLITDWQDWRLYKTIYDVTFDRKVVETSFLTKMIKLKSLNDFTKSGDILL